MIVSNLAQTFGTRSDAVELSLAFIMMIVGIIITGLIQRWADKTGGDHPSAANVGQGGLAQHEPNTMRD